MSKSVQVRCAEQQKSEPQKDPADAIELQLIRVDRLADFGVNCLAFDDVRFDLWSAHK